MCNEKGRSVKQLLEKGFRIRVRNGPKYNLKIHHINNNKDWEHHLNNSVVPLKHMSIDVVLGRVGEGNWDIMCVDIDEKNLWDATLRYIKSEPDLKVVVNPTNRGGHLIFNKGGPPKKRVQVLCNLGFRVDYLNQSVNVLAEGKYLYDPKVEKWYKFNSSHYEHVPEKVLRIEKNFVFFKVQRTLETNKIPSR
jgi:hypothetical protein